MRWALQSSFFRFLSRTRTQAVHPKGIREVMLGLTLVKVSWAVMPERLLTIKLVT